MVSKDRFARFSIAIEHMAKTLKRYKNERLAAFGLHSMHLMFMVQLSQRAEGMTGTELAATCLVDRAFISRVTNELSEAGYVEFKEKRASRYRNKLVLTETGRKVMEEVSNWIDKTVAQVTSGISGEQLETFYTVLSAIDRNLSDMDLAPKDLSLEERAE